MAIEHDTSCENVNSIYKDACNGDATNEQELL
jgi:hypothetical protein